jgi:hypothetical protein
MNNIKKLAIVLVFTLIATTFTTSAEAYRCGWRNGHRVCWHEATTYRVYPTEARVCHWVRGVRVCR